jgi:hypothetical protein
MKRFFALIPIVLCIYHPAIGQDVFQQSEMHKELIRSFIDNIKKTDSMSIMVFRHFFHDFDNEQQMRIAEEYCKKELNFDCDNFVETIRYGYDQDVLNYFLTKMKEFFHGNDSVIEIIRIEECKFLTYKIIICDFPKIFRTCYFEIGCDSFEGEFIKLVEPSERKLYSKSPFEPLFFPCCIDYIFDDHLNSVIYEIDTSSYEKGVSVLKELRRITKNPE